MTSIGDIIAGKAVGHKLRELGAGIQWRPVLHPKVEWERWPSSMPIEDLGEQAGEFDWIQLLPPATVHIAPDQRAASMIGGTRSEGLCPLGHQFENVLLEPLRLSNMPEPQFRWQTTIEYLGFPGGFYLPIPEHILDKALMEALPELPKKDTEQDIVRY